MIKIYIMEKQNKIPSETPYYDWNNINNAPKDGSEIVGWVPTKGHVLMRFIDNWQFYNSIPCKNNVGFYSTGWSRLGDQPTAWRFKQEKSTEWIF